MIRTLLTLALLTLTGVAHATDVLTDTDNPTALVGAIKTADSCVDGIEQNRFKCLDFDIKVANGTIAQAYIGGMYVGICATADVICGNASLGVLAKVFVEYFDKHPTASGNTSVWVAWSAWTNAGIIKQGRKGTD
jgi:hypothetical protein